MPAPLTNFRAVARSKVYTDIVEQIMENIRAGTFPPGQALPPERVLAEQLRVSRTTLREAIRVLEHAGVLDVRGGSGTYVMENCLSDATTLRTRATLVGDYSPLDLIVVRVALEPLGAESAAQSRYGKDLQAMEGVLAQHTECIRHGEDPSDADAAFHLAVAGSSHNDVMIDIQAYFSELMHQRTWSDLKLKSRTRNNELFLNQHAAIYDAIRRRDAPSARAAMLDHLHTVQRALAEEVAPTRGPRRSQSR